MAMRSRPVPEGDRPRRPRGDSLLRTSFTSRPGALGSFSHTGAPGGPTPSFSFDILLAEFTTRWEKGEQPRAEEFLARISHDSADDAVVLIYREFCLAEAAGLSPSPRDYVERFPTLAATLERLFGLQDAFDSSQIRLWSNPDTAESILPQEGEDIGPFHLLRELGRGGFARVFLAEQTELENSLLVLKISTRVTTEPSLMARAAHPNIVTLQWHNLVDDGAFQIIAMPFLGGATLSTILIERRKRGKRPASGRDFLAELDAASAPEYPRPGSGRPAREAIDLLNYPRAVAWLIARLAEALDHAYTRGVLHGDVKPSNILLTAECMPMLLDFNLSVGWRPQSHGPGSSEVLAEGGGTLAYMAPERLVSVAEPSTEPPRSRPVQRHRADIYSLGVVLLELLTGRSPDIASDRPLSMSEMASVYVSSRSQGGEAMIRGAHRPIPSSLRAILRRCLASDPADRYARAQELAEDLEAWRRDKPLIYARESRPGQDALRWYRRRKRWVTIALLGLIVAVLTVVSLRQIDKEPRRKKAINYQQVVGSEFSGAFRDRRTGSGWVKFRGDPVLIARNHLEHYGVLNSTNWREREEYLSLDPAEREELEAWLLEQSLRYASALGARPDPIALRRARYFLDIVESSAPYGPLQSECQALRQRLGEPPAFFKPLDARSTGIDYKPWIEAYLRGVEAEIAASAPGTARLLIQESRDADSYSRAAGFYRAVLKLHPNSFWGNYRFASVAFSLAQDAGRDEKHVPAHCHQEDAVRAMGLCVRLRPNLAVLHSQYAGCLYGLAKFDEKNNKVTEAARYFAQSSEEYSKAQELDPDNPETYLSRAFLDIELGQIVNYRNDMRQYDLLTSQTPGKSLDLDALGARLRLADTLYRKKHFEDASTELKRISDVNPDDLKVRLLRAHALGESKRKEESAVEFEAILSHPDFERLLRGKNQWNKDLIAASEQTVESLVRRGKYQEAIHIARRGEELARELGHRTYQANIALAQSYALAFQQDKKTDYERLTIETLRRARSLSPSPTMFKKDYEDESVKPFMELKKRYPTSFFEVEVADEEPGSEY